jgi:hypothetical protein
MGGGGPTARRCPEPRLRLGGRRARARAATQSPGRRGTLPPRRQAILYQETIHLLRLRTARLSECRGAMCSEVAAAARLDTGAVGADAVGAAAGGADAAAELAVSVRCEMAVRVAHTLVSPAERIRRNPSTLVRALAPGPGPVPDGWLHALPTAPRQHRLPTHAPPPAPLPLPSQAAFALLTDVATCLIYAATGFVPINGAASREALRQLLVFEPEALPPWERHPERMAAAADEAAAAAAGGQHRSQYSTASGP